MKYLSYLTISLLSVGMPLVTFAADSDSPITTSVVTDTRSVPGLSITRYSSTSAELFWDRSTIPGLRYEVSRDSVLLGTTNGTSFYDNNLSVDEPFHNYFVVALDSDDRELANDLIVLGAGADSGGIPSKPSSGPLPPSGGDAPVLTNATITVYSDTAAELFWALPDASFGITEVDVYRNGELIGSTNGISFFDGARTSGEVYSYELVPLSGTSIFAATVVPGLNPATVEINESNALDIWREVVTVINEDQVNEFFDKATDEINLQRRFNLSNTIDDIVFSESFTVDPAYQYEQSFGSGELVDLVDGDAYTCAGGGGIHFYINQSFQVGSDSVFTDCAVTNAISDGVTYSGITGGRNIFRGSISSAVFKNFTRVSSNGETTVLSGSNSGGNRSYLSISRIDGWAGLNFRQTNSVQDFQLSNFNVKRTTIDGETNVGITSGSLGGVFVTFNRYRLENTIEGSFNVVAPWTGTPAGLSVELFLDYSDDVDIDLYDPDLEFPGRDPVQPFNWETGSVTISASDSFMVIRPSETEIGSFELELSNGVTIGPLPWVDEFYINH